MAQHSEVSGPDFSAGIELSDCPAEGTVAGHVGGEPVLLSRFGGELFAVGGSCTHYGASLASGRIDGATARCPLHHACFDLRTGAALRAPALDPLGRWQVELDGETAFVRRKSEPARPPASNGRELEVVIVGGGAAGLACANELRALGHSGPITMLSADSDPPYDRPNLSKDYLAGTAPDEWMPLRTDEWYSERRIDLRLQAAVRMIDPEARTVTTASGEQLRFDRLLLATGSEARRLNERGFAGDDVLTLRSFGDARTIASHATPGARTVVVGASFIALEAAAALRKRGVEVDVVAPGRVPFDRVLGTDLGRFLQRLHEENGVRFHLGTVTACRDNGNVHLADGQRIPADFVVLGVGVQPRTALAEAAGLTVGDGVWVDSSLQTSVPGIFAAGDVAAYPDPLTGERVRVEHWVVAERQGQTAAANMLGRGKRFDAVPFFWTEQFGVAVRYVGNAKGWDEVRIDGDAGAGGFTARYFAGGVHLATATVNRDLENLEDERQFERVIAANMAAAREPELDTCIQSPG